MTLGTVNLPEVGDRDALENITQECAARINEMHALGR